MHATRHKKGPLQVGRCAYQYFQHRMTTLFSEWFAGGPSWKFGMRLTAPIRDPFTLPPNRIRKALRGNTSGRDLESTRKKPNEGKKG